MRSRMYLMVLFSVVFGLVITIAPAFMAKPAAGVAWAADEELDEWGEEEEEEDSFGNIMETSFTTIDKVDFAAPAANAPCKVTAKVTLVDEDEEATIAAVKLIYYLNGNLDKPSEVAMTAGADGAYSGQIPGQPAGAKVDFAIRVEDSNGNASTNAVSSSKVLAQAVPDMDNSAEIVGDDADLLGFGANYDDTYLYVTFNVQGKVVGGTLDPPYLHLYGIKISNPDQDSGEGLMVGKLLFILPILKEKAAQDILLTAIFEESGGVAAKVAKDVRDRIASTGMMLMDIGKMSGSGGSFAAGMLSAAEPDATISGGTFVGKLKRVALGENPSGYLRLLVLTAANPATDSLAPIPLNCSNFLTLYTSSYGYAVK